MFTAFFIAWHSKKLPPKVQEFWDDKYVWAKTTFGPHFKKAAEKCRFYYAKVKAKLGLPTTAPTAATELAYTKENLDKEEGLPATTPGGAASTKQREEQPTNTLVEHQDRL